MKRHKNRTNNSKNIIFYLRINGADTPLPSLADWYIKEGPESKEEFEDFRFKDWEEESSIESYDNSVLIALSKYEAEKLYLHLGKMLTEV